METNLLDQLRESPRLKLYVAEIQKMLSEEDRQRLQFYKDINEDDKAEFINGQIIHHTPVELSHNIAVKLLVNLLHNYVHTHDLGLVGYEKLLIALTRNDYEPDVCFFRKEKSQQFKLEQVRFPTPDFIVEVLSPGTEKYDRGVKFEDYAAHGVAEYWIVDPDDKIVEKYLLKDKVYSLQLKSNSGIIKSSVINGFEAEIVAIFDEKANLKALQNLLK